MDFSHHDIRAQFELTEAECSINAAAEFLAMHSADGRIVLASCKDSLLQALGTLTCHKSGVRALERSSKRAQSSLVRALLRPYENRAWGQSNWLLLRFWLGEGYAFKDARQPSVWQGGSQPLHHGLCRSRSRNETHTGLLHNVAPANPSKHFQRLIGAKLYEDEPFAITFLNSVLTQLNWAFSEFILLLQEVRFYCVILYYFYLWILSLSTDSKYGTASGKHSVWAQAAENLFNVLWVDRFVNALPGNDHYRCTERSVWRDTWK